MGQLIRHPGYVRILETSGTTARRPPAGQRINALPDAAQQLFEPGEVPGGDRVKMAEILRRHGLTPAPAPPRA